MDTQTKSFRNVIKAITVVAPTEEDTKYLENLRDWLIAHKVGKQITFLREEDGRGPRKGILFDATLNKWVENDVCSKMALVLMVDHCLPQYVPQRMKHSLEQIRSITEEEVW